MSDFSTFLSSSPVDHVTFRFLASSESCTTEDIKDIFLYAISKANEGGSAYYSSICCRSYIQDLVPTIFKKIAPEFKGLAYQNYKQYLSTMIKVMNAKLEEAFYNEDIHPVLVGSSSSIYDMKVMGAGCISENIDFEIE